MHYVITCENRRTGEKKFLGFYAKSENQAKFFFNSDETRRKTLRVLNVESFDLPLPNPSKEKTYNGDFDDAGVNSCWARSYHYNRKKSRGLL
jgi:hypothetical protein